MARIVKEEYPDSQLDFFIRKGNEELLKNNPDIDHIWVWDKSKGKFLNLLNLGLSVRKEKYDIVMNIQRFFNSGFITALSGAKIKVGFKQNPMSLFFTHKVNHLIPDKKNEKTLHEVQRNARLLKAIVPEWKIPEANSIKPVIFPDKKRF